MQKQESLKLSSLCSFFLAAAAAWRAVRKQLGVCINKRVTLTDIILSNKFTLFAQKTIYAVWVLITIRNSKFGQNYFQINCFINTW